MTKLSRRDFLKFASVFSGSILSRGLIKKLEKSAGQQNSSFPNILIFVFDTMTARNLSLYDYPRNTTQNLERFAQRATVYHQHYSAGNFTTPGTASLLTGMYPWEHRAIHIKGLIKRDLVDRNIFRLVGSNYYSLAFTQNPFASILLSQFSEDLDNILPLEAFSKFGYSISSHFPSKQIIIDHAFDDLLFTKGNNSSPASLVLGTTERILLGEYLQTHRKEFLAPTEDYPRGIPRAANYVFFNTEDVFDGISSVVKNLPQPSLAYFHLWPPHSPYKPQKGFFDAFNDDWSPVEKPIHPLGDDITYEKMNQDRKLYDENIASIDSEFGKFIDFLDEKGILNQSYVMVTSDHGESFERGILGHNTPTLYDPVIHIPLLISSPGQNTRRDVLVPTSSIDVLPTLLQITNQTIPAWCEGRVLPEFGGEEDMERSIFSVEAKSKNSAYAPFTNVTIAMRKGNYKMIYYLGRTKTDTFELYDMQHDKEEMIDLYNVRTDIADMMQEELLTKFQTVNSK